MKQQYLVFFSNELMEASLSSVLVDEGRYIDIAGLQILQQLIFESFKTKSMCILITSRGVEMATKRKAGKKFRTTENKNKLNSLIFKKVN